MSPIVVLRVPYFAMHFAAPERMHARDLVIPLPERAREPGVRRGAALALSSVTGAPRGRSGRSVVRSSISSGAPPPVNPAGPPQRKPGYAAPARGPSAVAASGEGAATSTPDGANPTG